MEPLLPKAPIDEVVVGFVLDQQVGPDAVDCGVYLTERHDRFVRHELHDPIVASPAFFDGLGPSRVWLISDDDAWLVQLQHDRFYANWRRRSDGTYPGFSRAGGAMGYALEEFELFQAFVERRRGVRPTAIAFELSKIDLLIKGQHWNDAADAVKLMPVLNGVLANIPSMDGSVGIRWQYDVDGLAVVVGVTSVRLKADPTVPAYRLELKATGPVAAQLEALLLKANQVLNEAFQRLLPDRVERFT